MSIAMTFVERLGHFVVSSEVDVNFRLDVRSEN